tara:strand:- start:944 stop:1528 length:585 start_codon:yes stop_codon:yes gene_type:complete
MNELLLPKDLKEKYEKGDNIKKYLRKKYALIENTEEIIEIVYDLQADSYIRRLEKEEIAKRGELYTKLIADKISELCSASSILEAGVGDGTKLKGVLGNLDKSVAGHGFDLCWSRVFSAQNYIVKDRDNHVQLCMGSLLNLPYLDNSVDVVYTSHSIESNGGNEKKIIQELYRVAKKHLSDPFMLLKILKKVRN